MSALISRPDPKTVSKDHAMAPLGISLLKVLALSALFTALTWSGTVAGPAENSLILEPTAGGPPINEVAKLMTDDAQASDRLGISIAISADLIVVGAYNEDGGPGDPASDAGAAYIFARDQGGADNWGEVKKLTASDAQAFDWFGRAVAISGDTVVVGARREDGGPGDPIAGAGAAYVYARDEGGADNWGEVKKLTAGVSQANDNFGWSVAINGDSIAVGAPNEDGGTGDPISSASEVSIFDRDFGGVDNWGQIARLRASDAQENDEFGGSVAISEDTTVVGAFQEEGGPGDPISVAGAAYIFERDKSGPDFWGEVKKLTASDAQEDDEFGYAVSISGGTIVVGAWAEDGGAGDPANEAGAAYVFERDQGGAGNWGQVKILTARDQKAGDYFGISVAISGDVVMVAANEEDGGPGDPISGAGAAYVYKRNEGGADNWSELQKLTASDAQSSDSFGESVAISGNTLVVGAQSEDGGPGDPISGAGAGYVFQVDSLIYLPIVLRP